MTRSRASEVSGPPRQKMSCERRGAGGVPNAAAALGCLLGPRKRSGVELGGGAPATKQ